MDWLQVLVLAVVQGVTEFLPVSSSAHLVLVPVVTGWPDQGLAFDVALHVGSLVAVLWYFRTDLLHMTRGFAGSLRTRRLDRDGGLAWAILLGTIPVGLAGLLFNDIVSTYLRSPVVLAIGMIVFGLLLWWADRLPGRVRPMEQLTWRDVGIVALAQALALIPGTSRSGITLTAGLIAGLNREAAARFSFLLSIPVIVLAGALQTMELVSSDTAVDWSALVLGSVASAISAYLCIRLFLAFIQRVGMLPFVIYRLIVGVILLAVFA